MGVHLVSPVLLAWSGAWNAQTRLDLPSPLWKLQWAKFIESPTRIDSHRSSFEDVITQDCPNPGVKSVTSQTVLAAHPKFAFSKLAKGRLFLFLSPQMKKLDLLRPGHAPVLPFLLLFQSSFHSLFSQQLLSLGVWKKVHWQRQINIDRCNRNTMKDPAKLREQKAAHNRRTRSKETTLARTIRQEKERNRFHRNKSSARHCEQSASILTRFRRFFFGFESERI